MSRTSRSCQSRSSEHALPLPLPTRQIALPSAQRISRSHLQLPLQKPDTRLQRLLQNPKARWNRPRHPPGEFSCKREAQEVLYTNIDLAMYDYLRPRPVLWPSRFLEHVRCVEYGSLGTDLEFAEADLEISGRQRREIFSCRRVSG